MKNKRGKKEKEVYMKHKDRHMSCTYIVDNTTLDRFKLSCVSCDVIISMMFLQGASEACDRLACMELFHKAHVVKVNPDTPQQQARFRALEVLAAQQHL